MGPRASLDSLEKRKTLALARNKTCSACSLIMLTELSWLTYVSLLFDILFGHVGKHEYFRLSREYSVNAD